MALKKRSKKGKLSSVTLWKNSITKVYSKGGKKIKIRSINRSGTEQGCFVSSKEGPGYWHCLHLLVNRSGLSGGDSGKAFTDLSKPARFTNSICFSISQQHTEKDPLLYAGLCKQLDTKQ